jgi:ribosomal protein S12 methylthiotransferase accessory factor
MIATLSPRLRRAVSPYTGIVRSLEECLATTTEPPLFRATCDVGRGDRTLGVSLDHLSGIGGAGLSRGDAAAAAVGEALERYSATYVPAERLVVASAGELGADAVLPECFPLFSDSQYSTPGFPFRRFTAETRVAWVEGQALPDRHRAFLPAELVFLGDATSAGDAPIGYSTSSGMACGETVEEVLIRGLCEVLERDAFMIVWANRLSLPLLEVAGDARIAALDRALFARTGLRYAAVDLSAFHGLPTVLGVVRAPAGSAGAVGVGAGTAPTIERAGWKALSEAFAARAAGAKLALISPGRELGQGGAGIVSFEDHIRYPAEHVNAPVSEFLDASGERTPVGSIPELGGGTPGELVVALCERVRAAGSGVYSVDVTSPDVRELGLTVTKVLAPELCALDVPYAARFLGGRRLYEAAAALGLRGDRLCEADINPDPHPFP